MPEGPEIRRAADRLQRVLVGRPLETVWFARPDLDAHAPRLAASTITEIRTKGKALLTRFGCGQTVYSHNQLYGRWYVVKAGTSPRTRRTLRWALETADHAALLYSASDIDVLDDADVMLHPFIARAGIDLLSERPSITELREYIEQRRFAGRGLGHLLLDQGFIAGIGNYLRSEILYHARLPAATRPGELNGHGRRRVARAAIEITERAYATGGITNDPLRVARLKAAGWPRRRYRHYVFGRAGEPCHECGAPIHKTMVASRRLYACPVCQA